jgi:uncharacterized membrane protein YebE (DUF533 family)
MWRAVVAMVHADGVVTPHEIDFVNSHILNLNLSQGQIQVIQDDVKSPQDVHQMFSSITAEKDKRDFFVLARALCWCDGDLDKQEGAILDVLHVKHMKDTEENLLKESSEILNEVELCENQWKFKTKRSRNLLGFLNNFKTA